MINADIGIFYTLGTSPAFGGGRAQHKQNHGGSPWKRQL